jgi:sec-independent protein translocase protein TatA
MPFNLGWPEIVLTLLIVLIIFGVGKLPQIGGAIGKSIKEFRKASRGEGNDKEDQGNTKPLIESSQSETRGKS